MQSKTKSFVGINVGHHDSSICHLTVDHEIAATVYEEERFTRKKHRGFFPFAALQKLLSEVQLSDIPVDHFAATNYIQSLADSYAGMGKRHVFEDFVEHNNCPQVTLRNHSLLAVSHHEAHLFSVLPTIKSRYALIIVADGCGSPLSLANSNRIFPASFPAPSDGFENVSVFLKTESRISLVRVYSTQHRFTTSAPNTISDVYNQAAYLLFGSWHHCGKVMGLAAYHEDDVYPLSQLVRILADTAPFAPQGRQDFDALPVSEFKRLAKIAASTQFHFEEFFIGLAKELRDAYPTVTTLSLTGGSALNCLTNTKIYQLKLFEDLVFSPYPNDEGVALGAAMACAYQRGVYRIDEHFLPPNPFLGATSSIPSEAALARKFRGFRVTTQTPETTVDIARRLCRGEVIAWVQGRSECGPRALGHRSILASPLRPDIRTYLNSTVKHRESFRPYGVSILEEECETYFDVSPDFRSPFMSHAPLLKEEYRRLLSGIVHADGTIRIQTVGHDLPALRELLVKVKQECGHAILVHTSLNVMGEPIVETIDDLLAFFEASALERLFAFGHVIEKDFS